MLASQRDWLSMDAPLHALVNCMRSDYLTRLSGHYLKQTLLLLIFADVQKRLHDDGVAAGQMFLERVDACVAFSDTILGNKPLKLLCKNCLII